MSTLNSMGARVAVNDEVNGLPVLIVSDKDSFMILSFERKLDDPAVPEGVLTFDVNNGGGFPFTLKDRETGTVWSLTGEALDGPLAGVALEPLPDSFAAFWFAWASFNRDTQIYSP
jgi:hypothetical protein